MAKQLNFNVVSFRVKALAIKLICIATRAHRHHDISWELLSDSTISKGAGYNLVAEVAIRHGGRSLFSSQAKAKPVPSPTPSLTLVTSSQSGTLTAIVLYPHKVCLTPLQLSWSGPDWKPLDKAQSQPAPSCPRPWFSPISTLYLLPPTAPCNCPNASLYVVQTT